MARVEKCIQSVKLSDEEVSLLLDMLDHRDASFASDVRRFKRLSFRTRKVILHVLDGRYTVESSFRVVARNLSSNGMGFIHGQMLPPGKCVLVQIPRRGAETLHLLGEVAHCRHVRAMIHEVGIRFTGFGKPRHLAAAISSLESQR